MSLTTEEHKTINTFRKMRKDFYKFLYVSMLFIAFGNTAEASHMMGVDITYQCVGPCTYRIYHKTYFDCTGGAIQGQIPVNANTPNSGTASLGLLSITGGSGCAAPIPLGSDWTFESWLEVTPLCPSALSPPPGTPSSTGCDGTNNNPPINGVAELVFFRDYDFCNAGATCDNYVISWDICCRNNVITSLVSPGGSGIASNTTIINPTITPCNSSPVFSNKPVPYICAGQSFTFNQGAFDPDGDSLSYELGPCLDNPGQPVNYNTGYSSSQPLGPTWDVSINPLTGDITMLPNPSGIQVTVVMCVIVKEWRDGNLIGQVTRDMQITVLPTCSVPNPITGGVQNLSIGPDDVPADVLSFNEIRTCAGVETCVDIPVISQDPNFTYTITWNQAIPGASFTDASNPSVSNTIVGANPVGRFCWTPPVGTEGFFFFVVTVNDDACPVPGFNQFTVIVYVEDVLELSDAVANPLGCNEIELSVVPKSTIPGPYSNVFPVTSWSGNGNLNLNPNINEQTFSHLYPAPASYFYNVAIQDTFGCQTTLAGVANLTTGVTADAGPDLTLCSNYTIDLGTPALPGQSYLWSPDSALNNPTLAQPTFTYPNNGLVQASLFYTLEVTDGVCTTYDYVTVNVNPTLQAGVTPLNPKICRGDSMVLSAVSNIGSGNTFLWSTGSTSQSIKVKPDNTTTYSVVTFNSGCSSTPVFITVEVQEGPEAQIGGDLDVCPGDATTLTAGGANSYLWSAGSFSGSSITLTNLLTDSTVSVVGYDAQGCPGDTAYATISLHPQPVADFTATTICEGTDTRFTDISVVSSGNVVRWNWDFGDNTNGSGVQNPTHIFANSNQYNVSLEVTTENGCTDETSQLIDVKPIPDVDFTFTNVCQGLPNVFTDASTISSGSTITGYQWDFGGTGQATGPLNSHTFPAHGYYNVNLLVTTNDGCENDYTQTIFVHPNPVADFDVVSACEDSVVLVSTSSTVEGSLDFIRTHFWDFGDPGSGTSNTSMRVNPTHVYTAAQNYMIGLTVTTGNGCTDFVEREITVYPDPVADFVIDQQCENLPVNFTNLTQADPQTPLVYTYWDYGNGLNSNQQNGSVGYKPNGGPGDYQVFMAVRTSAGCVDTAFQTITIHPAPSALFNAKPECLNDSTRFEDITQLAYGSVSSWIWDFGDGQGGSDQQNPSYVYQTPGTYTVELTSTSDSGCVSTRSRDVVVYPLPEILGTLEDTACFSKQATLVVQTENDVVVNWFFSPTGQERFHQGHSYITPPLPYQTTYYIEAFSTQGCASEREAISGHVFNDEPLEISSSVEVIEMPLAIIDFASQSNSTLVEWDWSFGDGNGSSDSDPTHEFAHPGKFEVKLHTLDDNGCEATATKVIEVKRLVNISLPSAFSPNGDGFNDTYKIGHYNLSNFNIQIFNRWGQLVYESDNPDFEWDGRSLKGGRVQEGVYVYVLRALDFEGKKIDESRTITVFK